MKNLYTILFLIVLSIPLAAQEEPCPPTGVTTNPEEPVNNQHEDYINDHFDWTEELYDVYFAGGTIEVQANPYTANNGGVTNLYLTGDYQPEDGWELLYVDFGFDKDGNLLPSPVRSGQLFFVLYNKYRSIIRVFVAIDELNQNNLVEIELFMEGDYSTAVLASIAKIQQPLKSFDPAVVASNVQKFTNGAVDVKHWHYADFPVNYDPCTCEAPEEDPTGISMLQFEVNLVDEAKIELKGFSDGTIETMAEKDSPTSSTDNWDDFYGTVKKAGKFVETGRKGYKSFNLFKTDAKSTADGKGKETEMKAGVDNLGGFLTDNNPALKFVPYASEALAIIDFFVGGGKKDGPQQVTFPPMSIQLEHSFSGEITSNYNYIRKPIFTPGSSFTPDDERYSFGDDRYPIYNEVLGLYTILEKPKIDLWKGYESREYELVWLGSDVYMSIAKKNINRRIITVDVSSIKVALNKASEMNLRDGYIQIAYTMDNTGVYFGDNTDGIIINETTCVSPLIPLSCASSRAFALDVIQEREVGVNYSTTPEMPVINEEVNISIVLNFENLEGDKTIHKATWATTVNEIDQYEADFKIIDNFEIYNLKKKVVYDWFENEWLNDLNFGFFEEDQELHFLNEYVENDAAALEAIVIENSTIESDLQVPVNNGYTNLLAGESIEVLPDSEIGPNSILEISPLGVNCNIPFTDEAAISEIASICAGNDYQGQRILTKKAAKIKLSIKPEEFNVMTFPNPADEYLKISLSENAGEVDKIEVIVQDMTGRQLITKKEITKSGGFFELETSNLTQGVYILNVRSGNFEAIKKVMVK